MSEIIIGKDSQPFIKLFKSPRQFYIYSVNQNSVKNVSENVYRYLDGDNTISLSELELTELQVLNNDNFLSSDKFKEIKHPDIDTIEDALDSRMEHLVLQVTQSCNLTCSYCPYANRTEGKIQRNHTSKCMTFETARKSVDFFLEHSSDRKKNVISFYGGEPLISFGMIRQIVEYVRECFVGKDVSFNMTTNATLFTEEMMDFVAENKFNVVFSIDGPAKIHDINRKRVDGTGSFDAAFANLKKLVEKYGKEYCQHISLNMVFDPMNDVDDILELFTDPTFDNDINVMADVADDIHLAKSIEENSRYIEKMGYQFFLGYLDFLQIIKGLKIPPFMKTTFAGVEKDCAMLKKGSNGLPDVGAPGGPCIPGQRSLFVNVDGDFFPCEKVSEISEAMKIGSLENGFDYEKAIAILDIANLTPKKCKNCWALLHCVLCARFADDEGVLSKDKKNKYCYKTLNYATNLINEFILIQECKSIYKRR